MSEAREIEINETRSFRKSLNKLSSDKHALVEDEIEKIIEAPGLGERKKGDLSHMWVHKFKIDSQEVLLAYSWVEDKMVLTLMYLGPHQNFYSDAKNRRKADLKIIDLG